MSRSQTDERLRFYLNANQGDRERFVADLLPQLGPYEDCEPRRPAGGPDGGVDITASLTGSRARVLAAVGFKNDAGSSAADRAWARRKFDADLASASEAGIAAEGFAFVTNVDLPPKAKLEFIERAQSAGFAHAEVYDRERLRVALDKPEGFFVRLRYLDLPMSKEEQYRLLATVGTELGHLSASVKAVEAAVQRSSLRLALDSRVRQIGWAFSVDRWAALAPGEHSLLFVFCGTTEPSPNLALCHELDRSDSKDMITDEAWLWRGRGDERTVLHSSARTWLGGVAPSTWQILTQVDWPYAGSPTLYEFLRTGLRTFATSALAPHVTSITCDPEDRGADAVQNSIDQVIALQMAVAVFGAQLDP